MNTSNNSVMTNEQLAAAGLLVPAVTLPASMRVARGKGFVTVQNFAGSGSAAAIKASIKSTAGKISSKALSVRVNEVLRGEKTLREQLAAAFQQSLIQSGFVPSHGEISKAAAVIKFRKAPEPKPEAPIAEPSTKAELEAEIAKLNAKLAALASSK